MKVALLGVRPPVWRRLLVPADVHLGRLHRVLNAAMGWEDAHLHVFTVGRSQYSSRNDVELGHRDEKRVRLNEALRRLGDRLLYEYDLGDGWEHEVVLEEIRGSPALGVQATRAPECLDGARACPPEDCGGVGGYEDLLAILADPAHPEHGERREWAGPFDAEAFDVAEANRRIRRHASR